MARRSPRWCKPPPKVLSTPQSKHVELCYALEGNRICTYVRRHSELRDSFRCGR
jgi:hypothetical protein